MKFKIHMTLFADEESFYTLCGIDEGCSERFYENIDRNVVSFGDDKKTTCKKCLRRFEKMLSEHDKQVAALSNSA